MISLRSPWIFLLFSAAVSAADLPDSRDPTGMKRYEGSEIVGYRGPKFDEFLVPLGVQTSFGPVAYEKSVKAEGLVSRYTYLAPTGRTATEIARNYRQEFARLGLTVVYAKAAGEKGWFGPTFDRIAEEDRLGQILAYNESQEHVLVAKSKDAKPAYYYLFVTAYKDGIIPERLAGSVTPGRALAELIVIQPEQLTQKMVFVNAEEMASTLKGSGRIALYGIYFDTDKDTPRADSQPTLAEMAKLLTSNPALKIRVVGHTDNTGTQEHNLDLSRRRAAAVVLALVSQYKIAASRLDSFGAGSYAPVASNGDDQGRSKNRRVELVEW